MGKGRSSPYLSPVPRGRNAIEAEKISSPIGDDKKSKSRVKPKTKAGKRKVQPSQNNEDDITIE
jgi:hypothetical protein